MYIILALSYFSFSSNTTNDDDFFFLSKPIVNKHILHEQLLYNILKNIHMFIYFSYTVKPRLTDTSQ